MRSRSCSLLTTVVLVSLGATPAHAEFTAAGRKRTPPSGAPKPSVRPILKGPESGNSGPVPGPGREGAIARYTAIVLAQPTAAFPLKKLAELCRERDGTLRVLLADFEQRATSDPANGWKARLALADFLKQNGQPDEARRAYEAVLKDRPLDGQVIVGLAQLLAQQGDAARARQQYESAVPHLSNAVDKEQTLRALLTLALDAHDVPGARGYHRQLLTLLGNSAAIKGELGRELAARGLDDAAALELQEAVKGAAGDNRALAGALRDLGVVQIRQRKTAAAIGTLQRALLAAAGEPGLRGELLQALADAYRADNNPAGFITVLEKEGGADAPRLRLLATLYEETGAVPRAITALRRAVAADGRHLETRLRLLRLLQAQGELEAAVAENEALIRAAPRNADFVFQLCETLLQRGDRTRALAQVARLESNAGADEDVLARVADFYERVGEKDRATKMLVRIAASATNDPRHLTELGDRYWQAGKKKEAQETWQRLRFVVSPRTKGLLALGDVLLDHDLADEGLAVLKEAVDLDPRDSRATRTYALALERSAPGSGRPAVTATRFETARQLWEALLERSGNDKLLTREARTHIVTIWGLLKQLEARVEPLRRRLYDTPPDLEAGRLLAEAQIRLRRPKDAAATLTKLSEKLPGDEDVFLALERVSVLTRDLPGAIRALEKVVELNPVRARDAYQRMSAYAAELYRDDDAIAYAAKAVALQPDDAEGHRKLGQMYHRRQDHERAVAAFRQAIAKNDRLYAAYFELAELLVATGRAEAAEEADRLYRRIVRSAPDEELIAQAGRLALQRRLAQGSLSLSLSLSELENEWLPLALGAANKPVYRRLLVETYYQFMLPLLPRLRSGTPAEAAEARKQLAKLGARGVKPLLDALSDPQESQVTMALDLLTYLPNQGAGPALLAFATSNAEAPLRARAVMATALLPDPSLFPRYEALLFPPAAAVAPGDPIAVAAAWCVVRLQDRRAAPLVAKLRVAPSPELRALGTLVSPGLASPAGVPSEDPSPLVRAASALALRDPRVGAPTGVLERLARDPDAFVRSAAYAALALRRDPSTVDLVVPALFADDDAERQAATSALVAYVLADASPPVDRLPLNTDGSTTVRAALRSLGPGPFPAATRLRALQALSEPIARRATAIASSFPARAFVVLDVLDLMANMASAPVGALRLATFPAVAILVRHADPRVRIRALRALEGSDHDAAFAALAAALHDPDTTVIRTALAVAEATPRARIAALAAKLLVPPSSVPSDWPTRVAAAHALGVVTSREEGPGRAVAVEALAHAAQHDDFALVRTAARDALAETR